MEYGLDNLDAFADLHETDGRRSVKRRAIRKHVRICHMTFSDSISGFSKEPDY